MRPETRGYLDAFALWGDESLIPFFNENQHNGEAHKIAVAKTPSIIAGDEVTSLKYYRRDKGKLESPHVASYKECWIEFQGDSPGRCRIIPNISAKC